MKILTKSPYTKATGISLLLHAILLSALVMLGASEPAASPVVIDAIGVEITAASVLDTGDTEIDDTPAPPPIPARTTATASLPTPASAAMSAPSSQQSGETAAQTAPHTDASAMSGEAGGTSVAVAASTGTGVVDAVVVNGGNSGEGQGDKGGGSGEQTTLANCLYTPKPAYPRTARKAGWEGDVVVRVLIGTDGSAATVTVREGSNYQAFDDAALLAVKKWRFSPGTRGGIPIASFLDVKVHFRLSDA